MKKKNQQLYAAIAIVVVVVALIWYFKTNPGNTVSDSVNQTKNGTGSKNPGNTSSTKASVWTGTLKKSDNSSKGNFMLVTKDRTIYFTTVRDFSSLIDKKVNLTYEGSLKGFTVLNLTAAQ